MPLLSQSCYHPEQEIVQRVDDEVVDALLKSNMVSLSVWLACLLASTSRSEQVVYAMGSLYTSLGASLIAKGLGRRIVQHAGRKASVCPV